MIKQLSDIRSGHRKNPSMQGLAATLSRTDLVDVVAYLAALPISDRNGKGPGTSLKLGKQLYERIAILAGHFAKLGANTAVRQRALGHQTSAMAERYSHLELDPVADATTGRISHRAVSRSRSSRKTFVGSAIATAGSAGLTSRQVRAVCGRPKGLAASAA